MRGHVVAHARRQADDSNALPLSGRYACVGKGQPRMTVAAKACASNTTGSFEAGLELGRGIREGLGHQALSVVLAHATIAHDQQAFLAGLRESVGSGVAIFGGSAQGVMSRGAVCEEGYAAGALGLGGPSLSATVATAAEFHVDPQAKGRELGRALRKGARQRPSLIILEYDPLRSSDLDRFLEAMHAETECPIIGTGASESWRSTQHTYQYSGMAVLRDAAVALALSGDFHFELDICHGTAPIGLEMTVTKAEGNVVLEFDGRAASEVWEALSSEPAHMLANNGTLGIGMPTATPGEYLVRSVFGVDAERSAIVFQTAIPVGSRVSFQDRTVLGVLEGTRAMGDRIAGRLGRAGKTPRAVLGFECGARTRPFLGTELTLDENCRLQQAVGPNAEWLGALAWGEVFMFGGKPRLANFSFPLIVLAD